MAQKTPMKLRPFISETVWGGKRLVEEYHIDPQGRANCAEAWVCAAHPNGSSTAETGPYTGMRLDELFAREPELFGKKCAGHSKLPILVKLIDAREDLSIQVHPRDTDSAVLRPGESGKTECWYILAAEPDATLCLGFQEEISPEVFAQAIAGGSLMEHVQRVSVSPGDFFYIPAGTLHAIGKGILLAEVQQNSDTTYRVYDYNRLQNGKPRELHIDQACAVTELKPYAQPQARDRKGPLISNELFTVAEAGGPQGFSGTAAADSFVSLVFIDAQGDCALHCADEVLSLRKGDSILIPAAAGAYRVTGHCRALVSSFSSSFSEEKEAKRL